VLRDTEFLFAIIDGIGISRLLYPDIQGPARMLGIVKELVLQTQPKTPLVKAQPEAARSKAQK
jgi:hypothetical protein